MKKYIYKLQQVQGFEKRVIATDISDAISQATPFNGAVIEASLFDDRSIDTLDSFKVYSMLHNCTIAEAIADRDEPANLETCIEWFELATGRKPVNSEIDTMHPDSSETIRKQIDYYKD